MNSAPPVEHSRGLHPDGRYLVPGDCLHLHNTGHRFGEPRVSGTVSLAGNLAVTVPVVPTGGSTLYHHQEHVRRTR